MDDLVQWLSEQLDEDERITRAADAELSNVFTRVANFDPEMAADERHIMTHRPARVLREIDAKRQILATHEVVGGFEDEDMNDLGSGCSLCGYSAAYSEGGWCETLRLLALPYADRPGYREEWRP